VLNLEVAMLDGAKPGSWKNWLVRLMQHKPQLRMDAAPAPDLIQTHRPTLAWHLFSGSRHLPRDEPSSGASTGRISKHRRVGRAVIGFINWVIGHFYRWKRTSDLFTISILEIQDLLRVTPPISVLF
jgi:hypothetical protein